MIPHNPPIRPAMGAFEYMGAQSRPLSLGRNPATNSDRRGSSLPGNNGMGRIAKFPTYRASFFANQLLRSGVIHSRPITEMGRPLPNPATLWERPARAGTAPPRGRRSAACGEHPLVCGDHLSARTIATLPEGSSPRVRGPHPANISTSQKTPRRAEPSRTILRCGQHNMDLG